LCREGGAAESIVCVSDDAIRIPSLSTIQIESVARFFEEAVDEEADPSRIGNQAEPDLSPSPAMKISGLP